MLIGSQAAALPREVRELAERLGATGDAAWSSVTLSQRGTMRNDPAGWAMWFRAVQTIDLQHCEFTWRAAAGPFGCISVIDSFKDGQAKLEARLFGWLPIALANGGAALAKGEIMRYLAELAFAPDAIVCNPLLAWTVINETTLRVSAGRNESRGEVELRLDGTGRIAGVFALDRPRKEGSGFVERPWQGRFFDYRRHQGRWLPFAGEVGWVLDGQSFVAWRGELTGWQAGAGL